MNKNNNNSQQRQQPSRHLLLLISIFLIAFTYSFITTSITNINDNNNNHSFVHALSSSSISNNKNNNRNIQQQNNNKIRSPLNNNLDANNNDDELCLIDMMECNLLNGFSTSDSNQKNDINIRSHTSTRLSNNKRLDTALDMVCNDNTNGVQEFNQNNFDMHVGTALDTLRKDYPNILINDPDYTIYDPNIILIDPSGVKIKGLKLYKNSYRVLHTLINILYCPLKSKIQIRLCYDQARHNIRIHWNVNLIKRDIFNNIINPDNNEHHSYVDGISVYELDRYSGNITEHRIERLLWNDNPIMPKEGIIAVLQRQQTVSVPSFIKQYSDTTNDIITNNMKDNNNNIVLSFQQRSPLNNLYHFMNHNNNVKSLFAFDATNSDASVGNNKFEHSSNNNNIDNEYELNIQLQKNYPNLDINKYIIKNNSRKKFGLKPLTPEEYLDLEIKVQQMDLVQQELQQQKVIEREEEMLNTAETNANNKQKNTSILQKMFGNTIQIDTCESNYDCKRPEICCDFGFQKKCCMSGSLVGKWDQLQPIHVPADINNYGELPPGYTERNNNNNNQRW